MSRKIKIQKIPFESLADSASATLPCLFRALLLAQGVTKNNCLFRYLRSLAFIGLFRTVGFLAGFDNADYLPGNI